MGCRISRCGWRYVILRFGLSRFLVSGFWLQVVGVQVEDFYHVVVVAFLEED
jgi:hypothetical protein